MLEGWDTQACEAHESRALFGTIGTSLPAVCRVRAQVGGLLSCHFISIPSPGPFS